MSKVIDCDDSVRDTERYKIESHILEGKIRKRRDDFIKNNMVEFLLNITMEYEELIRKIKDNEISIENCLENISKTKKTLKSIIKEDGTK